MLLMGCGGVGEAVSPYLLLDTFTDTNGTSLADHAMDVGDGWTIHGATAWTVESSKAAKGVANADRFWHVSADAGEADVIVECDLTLPTATDMGVCLRVFDGLEHYIASVDPAGDSIYIREISSESAYTMRGSVACTLSGTVTIHAECSGATITASVDAVSVSYELATINQTATRFGLTGYDFAAISYTADGRYDNFTVTAL